MQVGMIELLRANNHDEKCLYAEFLDGNFYPI